jgi:hypothetical protein
MVRIKSPVSLIIWTTMSFALVSCGGSSTNGEESKLQTVTDGATCKTPDEVKTVSGSTYTCLLTGEKTLTWSSGKTSEGQQGSSNSATAFGIASSSDIPAVIQNWGFELAPYDPATGMAGAMKIKGVKAPPFDANNAQYFNYLFVVYGDPDNGHTDLQPQFFLPLGTPVISMVDGVVCDVPLLYSKDYSVRIAPLGTKCEHEGRAQILFETEHVINPLVKLGDTVKAGQQVATVSDYHKDWKALGFGVVEIGVFFAKSESPDPWHACPMRFFAPDKKDSMLSELASIQKAWEAETGDSNLYDESTESPTGCTTLNDFNDNNSASG